MPLYPSVSSPSSSSSSAASCIISIHFCLYRERDTPTDLHCERKGQCTVFMTRKKGALSCPAFLELEKAGAPFYICLGFLKSNSLEGHNSAV